MATNKPQYHEDSQKQNFKVYVGIDFGTDGSGFSYCLPNDVQCNTFPITTDADTSIKTKTNILLDENKNFVAFGKEASDKYLNDKTHANNYFFERFKMALYEKKVMSENDEKSQIIERKRSGIDIELELQPFDPKQKPVSSSVILTNALMFMKTRIMDILKERLSIVNMEDIQWIITVPAIWSNKSKDIMLKAAKAADMIKNGIRNHVKIAYEPDCAALDIRDYVKIQEGEKYMIVDLGAGTADICCHQSLGENEATEIWHPTGGAWGSSYIDDAFINLLELIFTKDFMERFKNDQPIEYKRLIDNFRIDKHSWNPQYESHNVTLPTEFLFQLQSYTEQEGIENEQKARDLESIVSGFKFQNKAKLIQLSEDILVMDSIIWKHLFDTVLNPLIDHIQMLLLEEKLKNMNYICPVGGLSNCLYVRQRIQDICKEAIMVSPNEPICSVARGAAKYGKKPYFIRAYCLSLTYGVGVFRPFMKSDPEDHEVIIDNAKYCRDAFCTFVRKGEAVNINDEVVHVLSTLHKDQKVVSINLFSSENENPTYTGNDDCKLEGVKNIPLPENWNVDKLFPVKFYFGDTTIRAITELDTVPQDQREIQINFSKYDKNDL